MPKNLVQLDDLFNQKIYRQYAEEFLKIFEAHEVVNHVRLNRKLAGLLTAVIANEAFWLRHLNSHMHQKIVAREGQLSAATIFMNFPEARDSSRFVGTAGQRFHAYLKSQQVVESELTFKNLTFDNITILVKGHLFYDPNTFYIDNEEAFSRLKYAYTKNEVLNYDIIADQELEAIISKPELQALEPLHIDKIYPYLNRIFQLTNARKHTRRAIIPTCSFSECLNVLHLLWQGHMSFNSYMENYQRDNNYKLVVSPALAGQVSPLQLQGLLHGVTWDFVTSPGFNDLSFHATLKGLSSAHINGLEPLALLNMIYCNLERLQLRDLSQSALRRNLGNIIHTIPDKFHSHISSNKAIIAALLQDYPYDAISSFKSLQVDNLAQSIASSLSIVLQELCESLLNASHNSLDLLLKQVEKTRLLVMHFSILAVDYRRFQKPVPLLENLENLILVYEQFIREMSTSGVSDAFVIELNLLKNYHNTMNQAFTQRRHQSSDITSKLVLSAADENEFQDELDEQKFDLETNASDSDWGDLEVDPDFETDNVSQDDFDQDGSEITALEDGISREVTSLDDNDASSKRTSASTGLTHSGLGLFAMTRPGNDNSSRPDYQATSSSFR